MNPDLTRHPSTDPGTIIQLRDRQYAADLIATALLHLDLFTWLAKNEGASPENIAAHFELAERPLDVMLTLCRAYGFIEGIDELRISEMGREHLVKGFPVVPWPILHADKRFRNFQEFHPCAQNWKARQLAGKGRGR